MTGTNSSNDRLILRPNVEINSNWYFSYDVFSGMKSSTTWNGNAIAQSPRKMSEFRDVSNTSDIRFLMVYRTIIDVILHLFIICNDLWGQFHFFSQTFRHNGSVVFGTVPPMCRICPDVNKLRGMDTTILGQHRPFMSIKSFVQHSGWQEMVSLCSLIRLIGVCADRDQPEFLCSRSDSKYLEVSVATAGGWLTRYRPPEVRNSLYRYRKIHIDYRSKFLYRFISPISIICGNTIHDNELTSCYHEAFLPWGHYHNNIVLFYHHSPITRSHFMDPTDHAIKGFYCIYVICVKNLDGIGYEHCYSLSHPDLGWLYVFSSFPSPSPSPPPPQWLACHVKTGAVP